MIPSQKQLRSGVFKFTNGQWHKRCNGPAHEEPTFLPATEKYFYVEKKGERAGYLVTRCRLCSNWSKLKLESRGSETGRIEASKVKWIFVEATNRIGIMEFSRRTGISQQTIHNIFNNRHPLLRKRTVRHAMLELISIRRKNEFTDNLQIRWRAERRINGGTKTCTGCGTVLGNFTEGCKVCSDRHRRRREALEIEAV